MASKRLERRQSRQQNRKTEHSTSYRISINTNTPLTYSLSAKIIQIVGFFNPLIATLKLQSNGPSSSNTVVGTLAVDGWAVTFGTARRGTGRGRSPPRLLLVVPNVTAHPSTASVPTSYYSMYHYNCLGSLKGQRRE